MLVTGRLVDIRGKIGEAMWMKNLLLHACLAVFISSAMGDEDVIVDKDGQYAGWTRDGVSVDKEGGYSGTTDDGVAIDKDGAYKGSEGSN